MCPATTRDYHIYTSGTSTTDPSSSSSSSCSLPLPAPPPAPPRPRRVVVNPLPLYPLHAPAFVRPLQRTIRAADGKVTIQRVLHHTTPSRCSSTTRPCAYRMDSIISQQKTRCVSILLATPLTPDPTATNRPACCLVSCGEPVVIKAMPCPSRLSSPLPDDPLTEMAAIQKLMEHHPDQPYVAPLLDCMQDNDFIYLVMPYLSGGDLYSKLEATNEKGLPESQAINYFHQMCEGLLFMKQTCNIAHHDISLENVMLTNDRQDTVKLIDLGMCLQVPEIKVQQVVGNNHQCPLHVYLTAQRGKGKAGYIAPEVIHEEPMDPFAADVWSLGVCLYIMLTGHPIYTKPSDRSFKALTAMGSRKVVDAYEHYGLVLSPLAKDLVCRMLQADPTKRPTLEEILAHPFLTGAAEATATTTTPPAEGVVE